MRNASSLGLSSGEARARARTACTSSGRSLFQGALDREGRSSNASVRRPPRRHQSLIGRLRQPQLVQHLLVRQGRGSHERDQGCFFSRLHASVPRPQSNSGSAVFLRTSTSSESSATSCFSCSFSLLKPSTSARVASRTVSACSLDLPASMKSLSHE